MKNLMIVDGCQDYGFDIHQVSDDDYSLIFHNSEENVVFIEDIYKRSDYNDLFQVFYRMWYGRIMNEDTKGIDGILFYESLDRKSTYSDGNNEYDLLKKFGIKDEGKIFKYVIVFDKDSSKKIYACAIDPSVFSDIFTSPGQDVEFLEDLKDRVTDKRFNEIWEYLRFNVVSNRNIRSIDGTIYIGLDAIKHKYPRKMNSDVSRHYPISSSSAGHAIRK